MENTTQKYEKYAYCWNMPLEEVLKERATCFDENGNIINREKLTALMGNKELRQYLFSPEIMKENANQEEDLALKGIGEIYLKQAVHPSWYWKMPDYYYAGLYAETHKEDSQVFPIQSNIGKIRSTTTRNEAVLKDCGWERRKYDKPEYFNDKFPGIKIVFSKNTNSVKLVKFNPETDEDISSVDFPFALICGVFLKCREFEYEKPWQLRAHDYEERFPDVFEEDHKIVRDPETHEIVDYGDWKPEK